MSGVETPGESETKGGRPLHKNTYHDMDLVVGGGDPGFVARLIHHLDGNTRPVAIDHGQAGIVIPALQGER